MFRKRDWNWLALPVGVAGGWAEIVAIALHTHPLASSSLDPPTQTSLLSPPQTSFLTPPQSTLARSATSLLRHTTVTLAISHFYMLGTDYFYHRYLVFQGGIWLLIVQWFAWLNGGIGY